MAWRRLRIWDWLFLVLGGLCLVGAAAFASSDPTTVLGLASFGLMALAVGAMPLFTRPPVGQVEIVTAQIRGRLTPAFVIRPARAKHRLAFLACLGLTLMGVVLIGSPAADERVAGVLCVVFFGFGVFALAPGALGIGRSDQMTLVAEGIKLDGPFGNTAFVAWGQIVQLFPVNVRGTLFVAGRVRNPSAVEVPPLSRPIMRANRFLISADISFSTAGLAISFEALLAMLMLYVQFPHLRAGIGTQAGLDVLESAMTTVESAA